MYNRFIAQRFNSQSHSKKLRKNELYKDQGNLTSQMSHWITHQHNKEIKRILLEGATPLVHPNNHKFRDQLPIANIRPNK